MEEQKYTGEKSPLSSEQKEDDQGGVRTARREPRIADHLPFA